VGCGLHTHLVIANRTRGPDGQWRTLDSRDLLNHRATVDAMYRAAYQHELTRTLGVRWQEPDRWGNRAIVGMPEELRRGFSKRHEQIAAELQRQEASGKHRTARLVQRVVHATRPPKSHETPETLYGRWQQEARTLGYEPERLVREITKVTRAREQDPAGTAGRDGESAESAARTAGRDGASADAPDGTPAGLPERTIRTMFDQLAGPEGLTEQASTFTCREVLCAVGRELPADVAGQVGPAELEGLADRFLEERTVSVMGDHAVGERRYATSELLAVEQQLIDAAVSRAGEQASVCSHHSVREALAANSTIGADHAAMVRDTTQGGQGVSVVVGKAGTGKTYALGVARHAWQLEGLRVVGAAPTGIATVCLDAEGFEHSRTVDALLRELDQHHGGDRGHRGARSQQRQRDLTRTRLLHKRPSPDPAGLLDGEEHQVLFEAIDSFRRQVGIGGQFLRPGEPTEPIANLEHLARARRREAELVHQDLRRHVVDVDQATVIELPRQIRAADAQLAGQRGITGGDRPGFCSPLPGGQRGGQGWLRWRWGKHTAAQQKRVRRASHDEHRTHNAKQRVAPVSLGQGRSHDPQQLADGVDSGHHPHAPLPQPHRGMRERDGCQQAERQQRD
jgi:hypothetical protein